MIDEAYSEILDRDQAVEFILEKYGDAMSLVREIVNYGTNLIVRCYNSSLKNETDIVIILHFLKQGVALLDAAEIQISNGAVLAAHITARSLFENFLLAKWITTSDTVRRSHQFYVSALRDKRLWASRVIPGSDDNSNFSEVFKRIGKKQSTEYAKVNEESARNTIQAIDTILADTKFSQINNDIIHCRGNRTYEPAWYSSPSCRRSIWKIAEELGMKGEYQALYSTLSLVTHNAALSKHISFEDDRVVFEPIRSPENLGTIISLIVSYTIALYRLMLKQYRAEELQNFARKYGEEWRSRYIDIKNPEIRAKYVDRDI